MTPRYRLDECVGLYRSADTRPAVTDAITGEHARFISRSGAREVLRDLNLGTLNRSMLQWHDPSQCSHKREASA